MSCIYATVRPDGRRWAAGCSPRNQTLVVPEDDTRPPPKRRYRPILRAVLAARRQWTPRAMKLALGRALRENYIDQATLGRHIGLNETAMNRAIHCELETIYIGVVAATLGYEPHGPCDQPEFRRRPLSAARRYETVPKDEVVKMLRDAMRSSGAAEADAPPRRVRARGSAMMFATKFMPKNAIAIVGPDNPIEFLAYAREMILDKTFQLPVGAFVGAYSWCDIWRAIAPKVGMEVAKAPEWFTFNGMVMVRDRSVNGNLVDFAGDGAEFHRRLMALPNGRRIFEQIERYAPNVYAALAAWGNKNALEPA